MNCQHTQPLNRMFSKAQSDLLTPLEFSTLSIEMLETSNVNNQFNKSIGANRILAGYTYFFQFLAHDIVPNTTSSLNSRVVSPQLNLDSVYGTGADGFNSFLFELDGKFKHRNAFDFDVWREPAPDMENDFRAFIPESRNDENIIVTQIHRLWQKLHNRLITEIIEPNVKQKIGIARRCTTAIFHKILIEDSLRVILHNKVHAFYFEKYKHFYYQANSQLTNLPAEFTHAAFRFGHSMVLERYRIKKGINVPLTKLLRSGRAPLNSDMGIDWNLFFGSKTKQVANLIDLKIVATLGAISPGINIVERNLAAGKNSKIASGESIVAQIKDPANKFNEFLTCFEREIANWCLQTAIGNSGYQSIARVLEDTHKEARTPLWLCILHENYAVLGDNAFKLGLLGSAIVGDVLRKSLCEVYKQSPTDSYQNCLQKMNGIFNSARDLLGVEIKTMLDLVNYLKTN